MTAALLLAMSVTAPPVAEFPLGVYWPIERLPWVARQAGAEEWAFQSALMRRLREEFHCNLAWGVNGSNQHWLRLLDTAQRAGLKLILTPPQVIWSRDSRDPGTVEKMAAQAVEQLGRHPALAAYVLIDEPRVHEMAQMEAFRVAFARSDPERPAVTVTMNSQTEAAALRTGLSVLCTDLYPFFADRSPNGPNRPDWSRAYYRYGTRKVIAWARQTGKVPWIMPQVFGDVWGPWHYDAEGNMVAEPGAYLHWRQPTVGETRWQIWSAVAEGAKGLFFYVLFPPANERKSGDPFKPVRILDDWPRVEVETSTGGGAGLLHRDGSPTPQMIAMGEAYGRIAAEAGRLARLEPAPAELAWAPPPLVVRSWRDPASGEPLLAVVNDDTDHAVRGQVTLWLACREVASLWTGEGLGAELAEDGVSLTVSLPPGDGTIVRLTPREGTWCVRLFAEDFAVAATPCRLENAERRVDRGQFSMGWDHSVVAGDKGGTVTLDLDQVAGARRGGMGIALTTAGKGVSGASVSADGKAWEPLPKPENGGPFTVPADRKWLRIELEAGGRLSSLELTGYPKGG